MRSSANRYRDALATAKGDGSTDHQVRMSPSVQGIVFSATSAVDKQVAE